MNDTTTDATDSRSPHPRRENDTLLKNVVDFLGFIYGNKCIVRDEKQEPNPEPIIQAVGQTGRRLSMRASMYKKALGTVQPFRSTTATIIPPARSGAEGVKTSKRMGENDYIERLLNHLVRTHSTQRHPRCSGVTGDGQRDTHIRDDDGGEAPAPFHSSEGGLKGNVDISNFVSETLDCFLRSGAHQRSACSVLSNLETDTNFVNLLSFDSRSNLQSKMDDFDETATPLNPRFVGRQAIFQSIQSTLRCESTKPFVSTVWTKGIPLEKLAESLKGLAEETKTVSHALQSMTLDSNALNLPRPNSTWDKPSEKGKTMSPLLLNRIDACTSTNELIEEETLSRTILYALEKQMRGHIVSTFNTKKKPYAT